MQNMSQLVTARIALLLSLYFSLFVPLNFLTGVFGMNFSPNDYNQYTIRPNQKIIKSSNFTLNKIMAELFGKDKVPIIGKKQMMVKGDCTGPVSAQFVLKDPTVDFAVLECARGGILKNGLAFRHCDVAIVTNISADHIGLRGISSMEQMAKVKAVVPKTVLKSGYSILNAEDDLVYAMHKELDCNVAFFSMDEKNPRIIKHCKKGGYAAIYENGYITIMKGTWKVRVVK